MLGAISTLIVDDSSTMRAILDSMICEQRDFRTPVHAADGLKAIHILSKQSFDLVLLDIDMRGIDGLELLDHIVANSPSSVLILSSGSIPGSDISTEALKRGAIACFDKDNCLRQADGLVDLIRDIVAQKYDLIWHPAGLNDSEPARYEHQDIVHAEARHGS
ncbi:response regulator [Parasphingorhabdus sp.]|jgi:two-component system chemotaxis response regulator CheB|uniref:response regulator n=1 Tax=Parasphingorhabdus sp. TaxID=2709688 RepID=UPI003D2CFA57